MSIVKIDDGRTQLWHHGWPWSNYCRSQAEITVDTDQMCNNQWRKVEVSYDSQERKKIFSYMPQDGDANTTVELNNLSCDGTGTAGNDNFCLGGELPFEHPHWGIRNPGNAFRGAIKNFIVKGNLAPLPPPSPSAPPLPPLGFCGVGTELNTTSGECTALSPNYPDSVYVDNVCGAGTDFDDETRQCTALPATTLVIHAPDLFKQEWQKKRCCGNDTCTMSLLRNGTIVAAVAAVNASL